MVAKHHEKEQVGGVTSVAVESAEETIPAEISEPVDPIGPVAASEAQPWPNIDHEK